MHTWPNAPKILYRSGPLVYFWLYRFWINGWIKIILEWNLWVQCHIFLLLDNMFASLFVRAIVESPLVCITYINHVRGLMRYQIGKLLLYLWNLNEKNNNLNYLHLFPSRENIDADGAILRTKDEISNDNHSFLQMGCYYFSRNARNRFGMNRNGCMTVYLSFLSLCLEIGTFYLELWSFI